MVLLTLARIASQLSWSLTQHLYNSCYWLFYGSPKTETQLFVEKLKKELRDKENSEILLPEYELKIYQIIDKYF
mgnify:CR=1 FL=1